MMDIENYFETKFTANKLPHLILTEYIGIARNFITNLFNEMIAWMEEAY